MIRREEGGGGLFSHSGKERGRQISKERGKEGLSCLRGVEASTVFHPGLEKKKVR